MQLEVNWQRQMPRDQRARRRSPRKMPMRARFPRRSLDSDWTARCHTRRRTSCLSCFRSHTYCNASPYSKPQVTGSHCSTLPYGWPRIWFLRIERAAKGPNSRFGASARNPGDHVDFVEQTDLAARGGDNFDSPERFENAIRERGRARAASGEGEDDKILSVPPLPIQFLEIDD